MDALANTATGLLLARTGLNRWTPLATPIIMLAANAPDLDFTSAFFGPAAYLRYRFGFAHSVAGVLPLAAVSVFAVWLAGRGWTLRRIRWAPALAVACLGVLLHLALDCVTSDGIPLLAPFSMTLTRLDYAASTDFIVWAVVLTAIAGPFLARLVGQEIASGSVRHKWPGRAAPVCALLFVAVWIWGRGVCHARALSQADAWDFGGRAPVRAAAIPDPVSPLRWRVLVETSDAYATADVDLLRDFDPASATLLRKPEIAPAIESAATAAGVRLFLGRARFPLWRVVPAEEPEGASLVTVTDLATGLPGTSAAAAEALVSNRQQVLQVSLRVPDIPGH